MVIAAFVGEMDTYEESELNVVIVGDNQVNHLEHYISLRKQSVHPCPDSLPEFNAGAQFCKPRFLGFLDVTVSDLSSTFMLDKIARLEPDIVMLHMTHNELDTPLGPTPESVGMRMYMMGKDLVDLGVSQVVMCQMIRPRVWRHFTREDGTDRVARANDFLLTVCSGCPGLYYWRHRGLVNSAKDVFNVDGVTLNNLGNYKLFRSFRGALMMASHRVLQTDYKGE